MSRKTTVSRRAKQLGITHKQIAHYCVLPVDIYELWLVGKAVISYSNMLRIAHLLDLEPEDIMKVV